MLKNCYAGNYPGGPSPFNRGWRDNDNKRPWLDPCELLFPNVSVGSVCDITDVHHALVRFDELRYVEKYPLSEGPGSDKLKALIDKRRAEVVRERQEATAYPDGRRSYSWLVAQRRVRDCFAGNFAGDAPVLEIEHRFYWKKEFSITDIHDAFVKHNEITFAKNPTCSWREHCSGWEKAAAQRADVDREYEEAVFTTDARIKQGLHQYSLAEAEQKLEGCYCCGCFRCPDLPTSQM